LKVAFVGQGPKEIGYGEANEDAYELAAESGRIALSDGASESFASQSWARLLAKRFVSQPELNATWLDDAVAEHVAQFDYPCTLKKWYNGYGGTTDRIPFGPPDRREARVVVPGYLEPEQLLGP
jgi:hypothetical protein